MDIDIDVVDEDAYLRDLLRAVDCRDLKTCKFLMPSIRQQIDAVLGHNDPEGHYFEIATEDISRYHWVLGEALRKASQQGTLDIVEFLLDSGADVNARNDEGFSALMKASEKGHVQIVKTLLKRGANINLTNKVGSAALQWVCHRTPDKWQIVEALLQHDKINVNQDTHKLGKTPLHSAAEMDTLGKTIKLLLDHRADQNATAKDGKTPLHLASERGHHKNVAILIQYGAFVNTKENKLGLTPLHLACQHAHPMVVQELLIGGADVDIKNKFGQTAKERMLDHAKIHNELHLNYEQIEEMLESEASTIYVTEEDRFSEVISVVCEMIPDHAWIPLCNDLFHDLDLVENVNKEVKDQHSDGGLPIIAYYVLQEWVKTCPEVGKFWVFDRALRDNELHSIADTLIARFQRPDSSLRHAPVVDNRNMYIE